MIRQLLGRALGLAWLSGMLVGAPNAFSAEPIQVGQARRVLAADYQKRIIAIINASGEIEWQEKIRDIHDAAVLPNGNILFQTSWTMIVEMTPTKQVVWQYDAARSNGNAGKKVEVHA